MTDTPTPGADLSATVRELFATTEDTTTDPPEVDLTRNNVVPNEGNNPQASEDPVRELAARLFHHNA